MLPREHFVSRILCFTTAGVKCRVAAVKSCPVLHFSVVIFSCPSGSLMPALLSVENWVPLKPVLGGVMDVALIYYPSCTDSIKPSQQFSCNFVVINAFEGSLCFQNFLYFLYMIVFKAIINCRQCKIDKYRIPKESPTRQNWKCCRLGLIEPVHGRYWKVQVPYSILWLTYFCYTINNVYKSYHHIACIYRKV
jgi:hypothetical protein